MIRNLFRRRGSSPDASHPENVISAGSGVSASDETALDAQRLVKAAQDAIGDRSIAEPQARAMPEVVRLLDAPEETRAAALMVLVEERLAPKWRMGTYTLFSLLARRRIVLSPPDLLHVLDQVATIAAAKDPWRAGSVLETVVPVIERSVAAASAEDQAQVKVALADLLRTVQTRNTLRVKPSAAQRLRGLVEAATLDLDAIKPDDAFGTPARAVVESSGEPPEALGPFLAHLTTPAKSGRPSTKWLGQAESLGAELRNARELARALLQAALDAGDGTVVYDYTDSMPHGQRIEMARYIGQENEAFLRNCVWAAAALRDADAIPLLRALAQKCIVVIGGQFGNPRSLTVALACPGAIAAIGAPGSLTALQGLQRAVRHGSLLREIGKAIDTLAVGASLSRSELLETAVELHDLDGAGRREIAVADWSAIIQVETGGGVAVSWRDSTGRTSATAPKAARDSDTEGAKAVSAAAKAIKDTIAAERARLDHLFLERRRWPIDVWRERYLVHPITGALARALVWRLRVGHDAVDGIPDATGSSLSDAHGRVMPIKPGAEVELWHPITATEDEVRTWRARLLGERLQQPLKQVFRELYTVTPAELETRSYSNRFARHIIRQVQARALMKGRGWAPVAVAWWDDGIDHGVARRTIEPHGIRVEFFFDPIVDIPPTSSDLYPYCTTDQVRFFEIATDRAINVADVPPLVFTEAMRDVDLFVGVTTIGADPQWLDRGERRFDTYWHQWGFGDLTQPAKVRREVIASILPALRIADRCTLTDRYLEVRGDLRTYKIHLGSSNILMSPADRYLCIVAARHPADDRLFLPFDDDPMLSLVLSKAFLLANDKAIKDESILRQIRAS